MQQFAAQMLLVFSDTGREHDGVQPAQRRDEPADIFGDLIGAHIPGELCPFIPLLHGRGHVPIVAGDAGYAQHTRFFIEQLIHLGWAEMFLFHQEGDGGGSTAPERVPIIKPSSGVRPMVVSMTRPSLTAARRSRCRDGR